MHELSLAEDILAIVEQHAAGQRVQSISLQIGQLAQVEREALLFALASVLHGSTAEGAQVEVEEVPASGQCRCGHRQAMAERYAACERCGAPGLTLQSGQELRVRSIALLASPPPTH